MAEKNVNNRPTNRIMKALLMELAENEPCDWLEEGCKIIKKNTLTAMAAIEVHKQSHYIEGYVELVVPRYTDMQFRGHFRMSRGTFEELCHWIAPHLVKERTLSVEKKILSTIWYLSNIESYRGVADRFGMNKGSLHRVIMSVCQAVTALRHDIITWPSSVSAMQTIASEFQEVSGIPGVIGAIDGTHIQIPGPTEHRDAYINRKGLPSLQLQVVVDKRLRFTDVYTGWPGSVHDSRVFFNSPIKDKLESLPAHFHIIGDSAYSLNSYLLVPFRDNGHLTALEKRFNKAHSSTRVEVEMAIGLLKGKFRRLKFLEMYSLFDAVYIIFSACIFHNFILLKSDGEEDDEDLQTEDEDVQVEDEEAEEDQENEQIVLAAAEKRLEIAHRL